MRHLGQERHVPPDTSGPASLRLAQLPGSPPPARNVERRNRLLDPLIRVELSKAPEKTYRDPELPFATCVLRKSPPAAQFPTEPSPAAPTAARMSNRVAYLCRG